MSISSTHRVPPPRRAHGSITCAFNKVGHQKEKHEEKSTPVRRSRKLLVGSALIESARKDAYSVKLRNAHYFNCHLSSWESAEVGVRVFVGKCTENELNFTWALQGAMR